MDEVRRIFLLLLYSHARMHATQPSGGGGGGEAHVCNIMGRCPFFKNLHNLFRKKNYISIPCFGIIRLENNRFGGKFGDYVKEIYPSQANTSDDLANYLDLTFNIGSNNRLYIKLYDKRDDFGFHIVNFPFLWSNFPSSPSYGVYIPS